jgi:voltage-dependent calcium channel L type alpha-1S
VEMVLKIFGLGIRKYVMDGFNDFDAIVVIVGLLEFVNAGSKAVTVLRAFRLLRIFKIVKSWSTLRKILETVLTSFSSIANLGLLMCLLIFIYALIGMQFLSGPIPDNEDGSFRFNFNSFGYSLITIFVLLTAENWNSILIMFIDKDGFGASIYFVTNIIFGNIMILNLFLAILLNFISDNLDDGGNDKVDE